MNRLFACFVVVLFSIAAAAQNPGTSTSDATYTLSGTVVNSATGEPVRRALVQIYLGGGQAVLSDGSGHFEFTGLPSGQTSVTVQKPGFFTEQQLDLTQTDPALVQVGPNLPPVTLKLIPECVITGRIESRDGEALESLPVRLIRVHIVNGRRQWDQAGSTNTDEDGQYRIGSLMPGWYYVFAGPSPESVWQGPPGSRGREASFPEVFYPGVRDLNAATPIQLTPGQQAQADLSINAEPVYRVSGTVEATVDQGLSIEILTPSGESLPAPTEYGPNGTFKSKLVAGNYLLRASVFGNGPPLSGTVNLTVNSDLTGVRVSLASVATVPVRTTFQTTQSPGTSRAGIFAGNRAARAVTIHLRRDGAVFGNSDEWLSLGGSRDPAANSIHDLAPGRYSLEIMPPGSPWYVRSAQCGGVDLLRDDLVVSPGARLPAIEIVLRDDGAQLAGKVVSGGRPARATVIAIPDGSSRASQMVPAGPDGSFLFAGLAPGDYSVLAIDRADGLEFTSPEALSPYLSGATRVTLVPNSQANVEVTLVEVGKSS